MYIDFGHPLPHVAVDFESYFDDAISINTMGVDAYLRATPDIYLVTIYDGHQRYTGHPADFDWTSLKGRLLVSHNAGFDYSAYHELVRRGLVDLVEFAEWNCTASLAVFLRAKRDLKGAVKELLGGEVSKDYRVQVKGLSVEEMKAAGVWENNVNSNAVDTEWTWKLWDEYADQWPYRERRISATTYLQCYRGLPLVPKLVMDGIEVMTEQMWNSAAALPWTKKTMAPESTKPGAKLIVAEVQYESGVASPKGLEAACKAAGIPAPKSTSEDNPECIKWENEYGVAVPFVSHMRNWRKCNQIRKKLITMRDRMRPDNRFPYPMKYGGAHTLRWSGGQGKGGTGETGFNPQNLPREPLHGVDLRKMIVAPKGRKLIIADAAQIEPRSLGWLAGDEEFLDKVRSGVTPYEVHARNTMGWTGGLLKTENKAMYQLAKIRVLGLGYGCGHVKFKVFAETQYDYHMTLVESKRQVQDFRNKERKITGLWNRLQVDFEDSVHNPTILNIAGVDHRVHEIELPSGRVMRYFDPCVKRKADVFAKKNAKQAAKKVDDLGPDADEHIDPSKYKMDYCARVGISGPIKFFYGGLLAENLTQATARDAFCDMLINVEDTFGPYALPMFTSHDEMILDADPGVSAKEVEEVMSLPIDWMPGCPFGAEAVESDHYLK